MKDNFSNQFATQILREESAEVTVSGIDRITGSESWDSTIESLIRSGWELEPEDIDAIKKGETVKLISPNGRRKISVSLKKVDGLEEEGSVTSAGQGSSTFKGDVGEQPAPRATKKVVRKNLNAEVADVETKLAAGKAKNYVKDKWGWKDAPSIPNRPSKGGFIYKQLYEELNENYSQFRNETKTRTKEQQFHTAVRLAEKKILEANRILEYTAQLKGELNEVRVGKHTQKLMERITKGIAEAYGKMKKLK